MHYIILDSPLKPSAEFFIRYGAVVVVAAVGRSGLLRKETDWEFSTKWRSRVYLDFFFSNFILVLLVWVRYVSINFPLEISLVSVFCRGLHSLRSFLFGIERCIACRLCEFACPSSAIEVRTGVSFNMLRYCRLFNVLYRRCIYCGFCVHICPIDAIVHSDVSNYVFDTSLYSLISKESLSIVNIIKERLDTYST